MDVHKNARLTPRGRLLMVNRVLRGETTKALASAFGVSQRTVRRWLERYLALGEAGLLDRSSRPHRSPKAIARGTAQRIVQLRRGRHTMGAIAEQLAVSRATVSRVLARVGLSRLAALDPAPLPRRYERACPGELLHLDTKKLGRIERPGHRAHGDRSERVRGAGWEYAYVAIDDHSRLGFAQLYDAENGLSATQFLNQALAYYRSLGMRIRAILTDNAMIFGARKFQALCRRHRIKHLRTRAYRPQTNGKAERFIQTALREWAYAHSYRHSQQRALALPHWLHRYNWHRPHAALKGNPPISRVGLSEANVLRLHS
jgi:transposase InsO family protein